MKTLSITILLSFLSLLQPPKPVLYIIGDSTVRNTNRPQCGWGEVIGEQFDTTRITVSNPAMAGRSTRTFIKEGRWDKIVATLQPGDFVIMQFGHNEGSVPDTSHAGYRGVLTGTGEETKDLTWPDGTGETVHTYGWYLRKFVRDAKSKGAIAIIASMIPRNEFREGKVLRASNDYGKWSAEIAAQENAFFIDLNAITADKYDAMGPDKVKTLFPGDHTHTNVEGAGINATSVIEGLKKINDCALNKYIAQEPKEKYTIDKLLFSDDFNQGLDTAIWIVEYTPQPGDRVGVQNGQLLLDTRGGVTVWLNKRLKGNLLIEYRRRLPLGGGTNDRLSDLNQFWMATDPRKRSLFGRHGVLEEYDSLSLYYAGMGGNSNSTTRLRKYQDGQRVLLQEYKDGPHLLQAGKEYKITTIVKDGTTQLLVDDQLFFSYKDPSPLREGYFGFRSTKSRQEIDDLKVYSLK